MKASEMTNPPADVTARAADLGHALLAPAHGAFVPSFRCPTCGARAERSSHGWSGWALDYTHERVISAIGPADQDGGVTRG